MSSLTLKPSFPLHSFPSTVILSNPTNSLNSSYFSSVHFSWKFFEGKFNLRAQSQDSQDNNSFETNPSSSDSKSPNGTMDVVLAMNTFIKRLLAVSDPSQMKTSVTETSAPELAKLLYWLMVVGYGIRNIEVRFDMERVLGTSPKLAELPPGENI